MAKVDGTLEWLVDEQSGRVVGQKLPDGREVGVVTTETNELTGGIDLIGPGGEAIPTGKTRIGLVVIGQSNERGQAQLSGMTASPQAFRSLNVPHITSYMPGVNSVLQHTDERWYAQGSPWCKVFDDLYDAGYWCDMANASIGSVSFFADVVGYPRNRANSANYFRQRRAPAHASDYGCSGVITVQNGHVFECTTGSLYFAFLRNDSGYPLYSPAGDRIPNRLDYLYSPTADKKSTASSAPDFTGATTVGSTVTDGAVVWTNIGSAATFGYAQNTAFKPKSIDGPGFDQQGILRRAVNMAQDLKAGGCDRVIVYLCNGQGDAGGTSSANYQLSLTYMTQYLRGLGFEVMIGLSTFTRGGSTTAWDDLTTAVNSTLTAFAADDGVHAGANLYTLMGATEGENGLTFNTSPNDGVHLDAAGQIVAGGHHAAALLAAI